MTRVCLNVFIGNPVCVCVCEGERVSLHGRARVRAGLGACAHTCLLACTLPETFYVHKCNMYKTISKYET